MQFAFYYIPVTAEMKPLTMPTGPVLTMALTIQLTAQRPIKAEAPPMVMMVIFATESTAALLESLAIVFVLVFAVIVFPLYVV
jgi:hypothetical protein